jgi:energy-coupling factor transporter transmembrane protein EcfT
MSPLTVMFFSPVLTAAACILYFIVVVLRRGYRFKFTVGRFLSRVLLWAAAGFAIAFACVMVVTAIYDSPQGPLTLFWYGPVAISVGIIVGTVMWRRCETKSNRPVESAAQQAARGLL